MDRPEGLPEYMPTPTLDLGDDHYASFTGVNPASPVGVIVLHRCPRASLGWWEGYAPFRHPMNPKGGPLWDVQSLDPLTISPSLLDHYPDNDHGFIREGRWIRA